MKHIDIYDPALCCATGVCGPTPDAALLAFAETVRALTGRAEVRRHGLADAPGDFIRCTPVRNLLESYGPNVLPVTVLEGEVIMQRVYPTLQQIESLLGLEPVAPAGPKGCGEDSCCG